MVLHIMWLLLLLTTPGTPDPHFAMFASMHEGRFYEHTFIHGLEIAFHSAKAERWRASRRHALFLTPHEHGMSEAPLV